MGNVPATTRVLTLASLPRGRLSFSGQGIDHELVHEDTEVEVL